MDDVIIVGSLDKKELEKSIQDLVDYVGNKTNAMASKFTEGLDKMKLAMKDFAVTQKVSVDLMKDAWRDMSKSFDAMVAAQSSGGRGGTSGGGTSATPDSIKDLKEQISAAERLRDTFQQTSPQVAAINKQIEDMRTHLQSILAKGTLKESMANARKEMGAATSMPTKTLADAQAKLRALESIQAKYANTTILSQQQTNRLATAIQNCKDKIDKIRNAQPKTIKDVLGMDESSVDAIAKKMQALKRVSIDPNNVEQVKKLGTEYQRLSRLQSDLLGRNAQAIRSNNMLAQSFGYIRNRIVYALTLGALSNFIKQVYEVRGQYELLERSLGVLVGSFERGSEIFNELNEMAIKSPFTLIELGTAAKQLTAYNFAADEVVDTTRRLADISAALGVSMERLTYNLGQIKAQGVLNARDARDFANAGLAIVPMLAQMYTEQKRFGDQVVTTAQVYDMMSKKLVSYSDVLQVLYKITDEGGKFFDFQAKQAETLKVQVNNLTLAMNNMYNEIGASNQGLLVGTVQTIKKVFENWRTVLSIVQSLVLAYGTYRTILALVNAEHLRTWGSRIIISITQYVNAVRSAQGAMATFNAVMSSNVVVAFASALVGLASYFIFFRQTVNKTTADVERFGESGAKTISNIETLGKILKGVDENTSLYKKTVGELNQVLQEYGVEEIKNRDEINSKIERTIELVQEESAQRQRANMLATGQETYKTQVEEAQKAFEERLGGDTLGLYSKFSPQIAKELEENSKVISAIVGDIIQQRISLIANKTGEEYEKGLREIYKEIANRLRAVGISEETIQAQFTQFSQNHGAYKVGLDSFIQSLQTAREELDNFNNKTEANYNAAKKATKSTMAYTEKIDANARALRNNANDAVSLYNKIYDIVKIAQQNHVINFDLKLTAQKPPQWMQNIDLPELQRLAARFTAIAQTGGHAKGYTRETTYEQGLLYASAAREKQYKQERDALEERNKTNKKTKKTGGTKKDPLAESLKDEIELIDNIQKRYNEYRKIGVSTQEAIAKAAEEYNATLTRVNATLSKYGIQTKNANELANMDLRGVRDYYKSLLDVAKGANNTKGIESLEKAIAKINVEITKADYKKITDGLNNELGKLKDEYELGIELDANSELGDVFADMMGLNKDSLEQLPHDFEGVVKKMQTIVDEQLGVGKFDVRSNLNKKVFDDWVTENNYAQDSQVVARLKALTDYANKVRLDETKKQTDEWNKLLEKYSEYEYKITQIHDQAEKEREIARKKNAPQEVFDAINLREQRDIAKVNFEEFQRSPEWITATGDLAGLTNKALGGLIRSLEEYKKKAKNLDPKQIKNLNNALKNLRKQQRQDNPFLAIANAIDQAKERAALFQPEMDSLMSDIIALEKEIGDNDPTEEQAKNLKSLKDRWKELAAQGDVSATEWENSINQAIAAASQAISMFTDMANALGGKNMTDATETINNVVGVLEKAGQGAALGAQIGGGYGAAIGAVVGGLSGLITTFADQWSGNKSITKSVEESERAVKRLELAYVDLEHAIQEAYGAATIGANMAANSNKSLQLAELKRQLALEESRKSKNKDTEKIVDLQKQIRELEYEIQDSTNNIINDLLGISSVGDAMDSMMDSFVEALRNGEDAMSVFNESIDDMIANMVKKMFTTRILQPWFEEQWNKIQEQVNERAGTLPDEIAKVQASISGARMADKTNNNSLVDALRALGFTEEEIHRLNWYNANGVDDGGQGANKRLREAYEKALKAAEKKAEELQNEIANATMPTTDDIRQYAELLRSGKPVMEENMQQVEDFLRELGLINDAKEDKLSSLQQGLQAMSESTAESLEAYMNGVSQQVYLHSDLLTQIRDAVVGFDLDVQTATVSQILLQLQNSYQVQMSIQSILSGWSNPSGMAMRVEMIS